MRGRALLAVLFFFSGATSLVYEVAWTRALGLAFGTTAIATSIVLATFMGGLGLGAWAGEAAAARVRRPLAWYGALEVAVAAFALVVPRAVQALATASPPVAIAAAAALLLVPAAAMGATFPIACRGGAPSLLYAVNTLGAVGGTIAASFALLPGIGLARTQLVAALVSATIGLVAMAAARMSAPLDTLAEGGRPPGLADGMARPFLAAAFLSGLAGLLYEVVFARALSLVLGGSAYALATMLATFLAGIGLGSLLLSRSDASPRRLAAALGLTAAAGYAALFLVPELPYLFVRLYQTWGPSPLLEAAISGAVLFLPALGLGASMALLLRAAPDLGPGRIYALNTAGAIAGALAGGLLLVPAIGLVATVVAGAAAGALAAALVAPRRVLALAAAAALVVPAALLRPALAPSRIATGAFAYVGGLPHGITRDAFQSQFEPGKIELLFARDGLTSTVTVERFPHVNTVYLKNNGKVDGSAPADPHCPSSADMSTQRALAEAPLALHGRARKALVVGLGGGVTAASALAFASLERLDVVEIEAEVARAVRETGAFAPASGRPLDDPRLHLHVADARHLLALAAPGTYDVIASQPAEPWLTGVANLFTREFFAAGRRALAPDGLFCQWLQLYGIDREGLATLLATFHDGFPEVLVLRPRGARELLLVGGARPFRIDPAAADFEAPAGARLLAEIVAGTAEVERLSAGAPLNTDDNARIEFLAARTRFIEAAEAERLAALLCFEPDGGSAARLFAPVPPARARDLASAAADAGNFATAEMWIRTLGDTAEAHRRLGDLAYRRGDEVSALVEWNEALKRDPDDKEALERVVRARAGLESGR